MKKLFIVAIMIGSMAANSIAGVAVGIRIEFGHRSETKDCVEKGFCKLTFSVERSGITADINDNTGNLEINISKTAISKDVLEYQFEAGIFEVPVAYTLSPELCSKLGIDRFTVKQGKYKVVETTTGYLITFLK
jgi:hypothetical protein